MRNGSNPRTALGFGHHVTSFFQCLRSEISLGLRQFRAQVCDRRGLRFNQLVVFANDQTVRNQNAGEHADGKEKFVNPPRRKL